MNCPVCKKHLEYYGSSNTSYYCNGIVKATHFKSYHKSDYPNSGFYIEYKGFSTNYFELESRLELFDSTNKAIIIPNIDKPEEVIRLIDKLRSFI